MKHYFIREFVSTTVFYHYPTEGLALSSYEEPVINTYWK
jgi:hypothetical protein